MQRPQFACCTHAPSREADVDATHMHAHGPKDRAAASPSPGKESLMRGRTALLRHQTGRVELRSKIQPFLRTQRLPPGAVAACCPVRLGCAAGCNTSVRGHVPLNLAPAFRRAYNMSHILFLATATDDVGCQRMALRFLLLSPTGCRPAIEMHSVRVTQKPAPTTTAGQ